MGVQKRKAFIINIIYFVIIVGICYFVFKELLPMFFPFVFGFAVAMLLTPLINFLTVRWKINRKLAAIVMLLCFYGLMVVALSFFGNRILVLVQEQASKLPELYSSVIEPQITILFQTITTQFPDYEDKAVMIFQSLESSLQEGIMYISSAVIGLGASWIVGFPAMLVQLIFMVISSFFLTLDFDNIRNFVLRQFPETRRILLIEIISSAKIVIVKILKVYALMMTLTFLELFIGLSLLKIPMTMLLAVLIAIVDILPVLGTGTVLIPWGIIACIIGESYVGIGILILYLVITVVRQTLEPKIIGQQVGLHPIVTLVCIFAGAQLLGILGIFLFPVTATIIKKMNDEGTIHILK